MSIKTTHKVTREFAIEAIMKKMDELDQLSNKELASILEDVIHNGYYNFWVLDQEEFDKDEQTNYPIPVLNNLENLPERNNAW